MPEIRDKISGLNFAQKIIDSGNINLKSLQSSFMSLPPMGQKAAVEALKDTGDPMLKQLAIGLSGADSIERPTTSRSSGSGESARSTATTWSQPTRVASSG